jgi:hypothetical protein
MDSDGYFNLFLVNESVKMDLFKPIAETPNDHNNLKFDPPPQPMSTTIPLISEKLKDSKIDLSNFLRVTNHQ